MEDTRSLALIMCFFSNALNYSACGTKAFRDEDPALLTSGRDKVVESAELRLPVVGEAPALDGVWQNVSRTEHKLRVFSAFLERRDVVPRGARRAVRVVGVTRTHWAAPVWCRFWFGTGQRRSASVLAKVQIIRENWDRLYSACFFICPLDDQMAVPDTVSMVRRLHDTPSNHLRVVDNFDKQDSGGGNGKLSVCVQPLHDIHDSFRVIEFIEMYSVLGAEHFTLYDNNTDGEVACVLDAYVRQGRVTLLPWDLRMDGRLWDGQSSVIDGRPEVWVHGIHAALNDCLYRNMYRYANVAMVDLDEFIVPKKTDNLIELLEYMDEYLAGSQPTGSYSFRNTFFHQQWPDDPSITDALEQKLLISTKTQRTVKINPAGERSKYICKPALVVETGNHFIWQYVSSSVATVDVDPGLALSQHYRVCGDKGANNCTRLGLSVTDKTAHRFKDVLYLKVVELWVNLKDRCKLFDF